ncbi:hypothetical protein ASE06_09545 [Sphingopyxis sp. Root214]|uniref:DUF4153 domain-containing protein n=1 Tax=unclassified Sphingopyxis TaxID=2614943 RepID=UPI0006FE10CF|nr:MULTISPECIES: DUF4153 domain-containing protein [unclassified Sphingopyxis]KQZ72720.1 hypothetical protein ASD73_07190 [Sphingopyxis sp. Root154]KRC06867.1 hypothetical protein ASE06_09545 [Sphingopyxis sp. Root214]
MTDTTAPAAPDSSARSSRVSARLDDNDLPWPLRPWIMAAICAAAGLAFHLLISHHYDDALADWRSALATGVAAAAVVFVLGVELRRWRWALGFSLIWGVILGLIAWQTAAYNIRGNPVEWPFWSGILAVLVATPLFQTRRDVAPDWRFWKLWQMPYERLHSHAWTDAVIGAASLAFVGITFLLVVLIGQMFKLIGINLIFDLLNDEWFGWMLAGAAFGGAVGLLRERDKLVSTLQRLVMMVLAVLAPVLAVALVLFLLSLAGTGLQKLWDSGFSTAAVMMGVAAFAVLLANAVIGNGSDDRATNPMLRWAAPVLVIAVLPLAGIAFYSMHLRVIQYGWTPERIWGVIAAMIALAYGLAGVWSVVKGRRGFDDWLRPLQQKLAIGLALLALFLALPILDFGAISTRDQLARLKSGATPVEKFDWAALAYDFGPSGRAALKELERSPYKARADAAKAALEAKNRWDLTGPDGPTLLKPFAERLRVVPAGRPLPAEALERVAASYMCSRAKACVAVWLDDRRIGVLGQNAPGESLNFDFVTQNDAGQWVQGDWAKAAPAKKQDVDLSKARIDVETVQQRRILVDGVPESGAFE